MAQIDSDSEREVSETESNPLHFIAQSILAELTHLDLSDSVTFKESRVVAGGAYGDISKDRCNFAGRGKVKVAIKRLRFYLKEDIKLLFEKEIYVWSKLKHSNVLGLLGYAFDKSGFPLLVSEWMRGGSAWTYVNSHADFDLIRLVIGIARGLAYLHENGVVHSDIKADNILVSDSGDALICDFGCSHMIAASRTLANLSSGIRGTSRYLAYELLAPGQLREGHTVETDVWAFGMTIYELSTRQRPYTGLSDVQVIGAILNFEVPSFPSVLSLDLVPEAVTVLKDICLACWNQHPSSRPVMRDTLDALEKSEGQQIFRQPTPSVKGLFPQSLSSTSEITDMPVHEVAVNGHRRQDGAPSTSSTLTSDKNGQLVSKQLETKEARWKRIAEEEQTQEAKEAKEREKHEAEEVEQSKHEEVEKSKYPEEVKVKGEAERKRKKRERRRKEQIERKRKEEEEKERLRKEEEDKARAEAEKSKPAALEIKSEREGEASSTLSNVPLSTSPETSKRRPIPSPLDLSSTHKSMPQPLPSALATARHIQDIYQVQYPEGIKSPKPELNTNAKDGKFRYDREFLLQFMSVCKEKPDNLPPLEAIGLEPSDQSHSMGRGGSGRRDVSGSMGPPSSTASRQASVGLGVGALNGFGGNSSSGFAMGNFSAPNKLSSEERFNQSTSMSGGPGGLPFAGGRPSPMVRSSSQGGVGAMGNKSSRSNRGGESTLNESTRINTVVSQFNANATASFESVVLLEPSASRWVAGSTSRRVATIDQDSSEVVDKEVGSLLNKLTMEKFESISNQIITWANKSVSEKDGRTLMQVTQLVFEKATDEAAWSEMYARLCCKMVEQISPEVQGDGIRNAEGKPITGGLLFRKYLLNRCKEAFERGWTQKESTAAAALVKATEDQAVKDANDKEGSKEVGESALYLDEYYAAQKAKRQGLGLVKFIGELFKLQMLTERIMHECIKKLLSNVDNPEEEEIESLCKLLSTVGQALDTSKARGHMDVYFSRMKEFAKSSNVSSRMQFMLQDMIELRERKWTTRNAVSSPSAPTSVFTKKGDSKRDSASLSRASSNTNMFQMLQAAEAANEAPAASSSRPSRPSSRRTSVDLTHNAPVELAQSAQRLRLNFLPRSKPLMENPEDSPSETHDGEEGEEGEILEKESGRSSMLKEQAEKKVDQDRKEFFAIRDLDEAEGYFSALPSEHRHILVEKFVMSAIEAKEADAKLVANLFERALSRNLCSPASFEEGFLPAAELLDDIAIDVPKAFNLMATMMKGAKLDEERRTRVASKSMDSDKLLNLLA